jgi:hypothetical protein
MPLNRIHRLRRKTGTSMFLTTPQQAGHGRVAKTQSEQYTVFSDGFAEAEI